MTSEDYARHLLTDAYDDSYTAVYDLELLMDLANAMRDIRHRMASGDCFFVRIELASYRKFVASYYLERDHVGEMGADGGRVVEIVPFDPEELWESDVTALRRRRRGNVDASSTPVS